MSLLISLIAGGLIGFFLTRAYGGRYWLNILLGIAGGFIGCLLVALPAGDDLIDFNYRGILLGVMFACFFPALVEFIQRVKNRKG